MRRVDLHPEDLFDHLRAGELRPEERERLHSHCEMCSACAFELELFEQNHSDAAPTALDHALAARAVERMLSTDEPAAVVAPPVRSPRSHAAFRAAALLLAGVLVGGSMSAAALTGSSPFVLIELVTAWVTPGDPRQDAPSTTQEQATQRETRKAAKPHITTEGLTVTEGVTEAATQPAPMIEVVATESAPAPRAHLYARAQRGVAGGPAPALPKAEPLTVTTDPATWFFRAASHARAAGRYQEAVALYGVLQRDFAGSETEVVARVALGRLWLGQLNDATQALTAFESYLVSRPQGPLAEEARSGRVGALRKLGRDVDAEAAMQDLVTNHPHSLYAKPVVRTVP